MYHIFNNIVTDFSICNISLRVTFIWEKNKKPYIFSYICPYYIENLLQAGIHPIITRVPENMDMWVSYNRKDKVLNT